MVSVSICCLHSFHVPVFLSKISHYCSSYLKSALVGQYFICLGTFYDTPDYRSIEVRMLVTKIPAMRKT